jgi:phosphate starvation-inducible PhoH-like protein
MPRQKSQKSQRSQKPQNSVRDSARDTSVPQAQGKRHPFHLEFLNQAQKMAWGAFDQHDVLFLLGSPGVGKTHLACAFAISEILAKRKRKVVLTRPVIEAGGESLGFLPGDLGEKLNPYMIPMFDCMDKMVGTEGPQRDIVGRSIEVAPIAFMRGRAETLDSMLVTPNGLIKMGDIKVNDFVIGSSGKPVKVTGVFPQGKKKIWKINFSDKTSVKCSEDHLWSTMSLNEKRHNKGFTVKTTQEIVKTIKNKNQKVHRMPNLGGPVEFVSREVTIHPYLMGAMLGDGHIRETALKLSTNDQEILEHCAKLLPQGMTFTKQNKYDYNLVLQRNKRNPLLEEFRRYALTGTKSTNKFVPENYKVNSEEVRLEVLRGLMDADGSVFLEKRTNKVRTQFYTTSEQLAQDVMFLVRSLGGFAYCRKREFDESDSHLYEGRVIRHVNSSFVVDIRLEQNPFKIKRKSDKYASGQKPSYVKLIASAEYLGEEECQCISVDADDRLYVTSGFNITHNTFDDSVCIFDEAQNATTAQLKLFMTRFGQNSKIIITGDPNQSDLHPSNQGLMDTVRRLEDLPGVGVIYFKASSIVRHPLIASILERLEDKEKR